MNFSIFEKKNNENHVIYLLKSKFFRHFESNWTSILKYAHCSPFSTELLLHQLLDSYTKSTMTLQSHLLNDLHRQQDIPWLRARGSSQSTREKKYLLHRVLKTVSSLKNHFESNNLHLTSIILDLYYNISDKTFET